MNRLQLAGHYFQVHLSHLTNQNFCGPIVAFIELTKKCNLRCEFCDIWRVKVGPDDEMTTTDLLNLSNDLADLGTKYVGLFGGEVMLRRDLWDVIAEMKRRGLYVCLDTNGYLLPQFYRHVLDSGIDMMAISLDSSREETHDLVRGLPGGFRRATEGLAKVQAENKSIKVVINTLVVKQNFRDLLDLIRMGTEYGVKHFRLLAYNFIPPYDLMGMQSRRLLPNPAEIEEIKDKIEGVIAYCKANGITLNSHEFLRGIPGFYRSGATAQPCFAGYSSVHVHANGRASFCSSLEAGIGNVRETRLPEIWNSHHFLNRRKEMMTEPCNKCYVSCYIEQNHWFRPDYLTAKLLGLQ